MKRFTTQFASRSSINRITLVTDHFHRYASSLYETVTSPSSASSRRSIRAMGRLNWTDSQSGSWSSSTGTRIFFGDEVGMCCRFRVKCLPLLQNKILRQEDLPSACKGWRFFLHLRSPRAEDFGSGPVSATVEPFSFRTKQSLLCPFYDATGRDFERFSRFAQFILSGFNDLGFSLSHFFVYLFV